MTARHKTHNLPFYARFVQFVKTLQVFSPPDLFCPDMEVLHGQQLGRDWTFLYQNRWRSILGVISTYQGFNMHARGDVNRSSPTEVAIQVV